MKIEKFKLLHFNRIALDFRFWILLFFALRLYGITFPPIETGHAWRQTFTCMVSRNFLEQDPNIFMPRTDLSGLPDVKPGVIGSEFPLFNYPVVYSDQHYIIYRFE